MIYSNGCTIFAGAVLNRQGSQKEAWIFQSLMTLLSWGFTIKRVIADREFSNYDMLAMLGFLNVPFTGPVKRMPAIRKLIDQFLAAQSPAVIPCSLHPSATTHFKVGPINVHVILKAAPGMTIRAVRAALNAGTITIADARRQVYSFITTEKAPGKASSMASWGMRLANLARYRWRIETGFRVSDGFTPSSHARYNKVKTFWLVMDRVNYDLWKLQQHPQRKLKDVPKSWREGQTRDRFAEVTTSYLVKNHAEFIASVA